MCPYPKIVYITSSYLSVLKLQNYSSQCNSYAFFRKIEEKLFWVIEARSEASGTNSFMNICYTVYVVSGPKHFALFSIVLEIFNKKLLESNEPDTNLRRPPPASPSVTLKWQKPQHAEGSYNLRKQQKVKTTFSFVEVLLVYQNHMINNHET